MFSALQLSLLTFASGRRSGTDTTVVTSTTDTDSSTDSSTSSIVFPTGPNGTDTTTATSTDSLVTVTSVTDTATSTTVSDPPLSSQFSFLTQRSLVFTSVSSTVDPATTTLTNADEATSTASLVGVSETSSATEAALPSGLPERIYPAEGGVDASTDLTGYTAISILFDNSLNWNFVAGNTIAAGQMLAYTPIAVMNALGLTREHSHLVVLLPFLTSI